METPFSTYTFWNGQLFKIRTPHKRTLKMCTSDFCRHTPPWTHTHTKTRKWQFKWDVSLNYICRLSQWFDDRTSDTYKPTSEHKRSPKSAVSAFTHSLNASITVVQKCIQIQTHTPSAFTLTGDSGELVLHTHHSIAHLLNKPQFVLEH